MKIIFLGAPGAGKGTQAEIISNKYAIPTLSTGAILREAIKAGTEQGKAAQTYIERGALVPDEVVVGIVKDRIALPDCEKGFILDGFPRTVPQAEALDAMGVEIDAVISLEISDAEIITRMGGRRVCPKCGATYHIKNNPSGDGKHCDKCGEELSVRKDDSPEVVSSRLEVYHAQTEPLKGFYSKKGKVSEVPGNIGLEETTKLITEIIDKL